MNRSITWFFISGYLLSVTISCTSAVKPKIDPAYEAHRTKVLAIQVEADRKQGVYVSDEDTEKKLFKACGDFKILSGFQFHVCEVMITDLERGEKISSTLAHYRYATHQEKIDLLAEMLQLFLQQRGFKLTQDFLDCADGKMALGQLPKSHDYQMSYGIPGVEHSSTIMHFSHTEAAVTATNLHSLLQEHLQQLQGSAIDVLVLVLNDDFMEAQFCLYSLHQK